MEGDERSGNKRGRVDNDEEKSEGRLEKRASVVEEEYSYSYSGDEMINGVKYEEEKETPSPPLPPVTTDDAVSVGLFDQLITNLVNTNSPTSINHQSDNIVDKGEDGKDGVGSASESGSIVDNIVAQLPRTLSDDTGPATDEASILIHSIIHD